PLRTSTARPSQPRPAGDTARPTCCQVGRSGRPARQQHNRKTRRLRIVTERRRVVTSRLSRRSARGKSPPGCRRRPIGDGEKLDNSRPRLAVTRSTVQHVAASKRSGSASTDSYMNYKLLSLVTSSVLAILNAVPIRGVDAPQLPLEVYAPEFAAILGERPKLVLV